MEAQRMIGRYATNGDVQVGGPAQDNPGFPLYFKNSLRGGGITPWSFTRPANHRFFLWQMLRWLHKTGECDLGKCSELGTSCAYAAVLGDRPEVLRLMHELGYDLKQPCDPMAYGAPAFWAANYGRQAGIASFAACVCIDLVPVCNAALATCGQGARLAGTVQSWRRLGWAVRAIRKERGVHVRGAREPRRHRPRQRTARPQGKGRRLSQSFH